jgi:cell surface protein SprA
LTTGTKSLTTLSSVVAASLLTWWSQAEPAGNHSFAFSQLWGWMKVRPHAPLLSLPDTTRPVPGDTVRYRPSRRPRVAPQDRSGNFLTDRQHRSPLILPLPGNVKREVTLGDSLEYVDLEENVGPNIDYRDPARLSYAEFQRLQEQQAIRNYFRNKAEGGVAGAPGEATAKRLIPKIYLAPGLGRIFGGEFIDIRPNGSATVSLGWRQNFNDNPNLTLRQRRNGDFNFQQNFNLNLTGQIGDKLKILFNYDTRAAFDFENQIKADFTGYDTDILRKVEMGNVSLPLNNSLVQGGQNLFGVKTQMQFGRLSVTSVAAQLRGTADEVTVQNGAQSRNFEIKASQYEANRHFFLSHYFRERYDAVLRNLPTVQSGVEVRRLEVYITNDNRTTETLRNVVALQDLGEPKRLYRQPFVKSTRVNSPASNNANALYERLPTTLSASRDVQQIDNVLQTSNGLAKTIDYERVRARKLDPREYTFNAQLGYLSLNTPLLPEQVLSVSYEYIFNGQTYKVGELQDDYSNVADDGVVFLKLLRATNPGVGLANLTTDPTVNLPSPTNPNGNERLLTGNLPTFDLMMKNIYALNASQLSRDQFRLDIIYKDDVTGIDILSLKEGRDNIIKNIPLTQVLNLDNVNPNNDRPSDGNFDFLQGLTIDPELGKIIFPVVEPFGAYLQNKFDPATEQALILKYVYGELYTQVQSDAQQRQEKDKFFLKGRYAATATDEITLPGIRIPEGSVRVYSGTTLLTEGQDYQVFYDQAKVKILNASYLNSAAELRVEFERDAVVQVLPRKLLGTRMDYKVSDDLNFGGTVMHLIENQAPGINRVNVGDEPSNNTIVGLDMSLRRESRVLTKYIDALPFINTKAPSSVAFSGEVAKFIPGKSQLGRGEDGVSYLDDFENARTPYNLGNNNTNNPWRLSSTPPPLGGDLAGRASAARRAKLAWYTIDQTYFNPNGPSRPSNILPATLRNHYTRGVGRDEVFANRDNGQLGGGFENTFDLAYYPSERGQYNYATTVDPASNGLRLLGDPRRNYGGISREITFDTDFDNANVEYLEFWMMDPFISSSTGQNTIDDSENPAVNAASSTGGELYFNLGSVSEDVLKDGNYEFENGLPDNSNLPKDQNPDLQTINDWGYATRLQYLTDAFSSAPGGRELQDVGLDGLTSTEEQAFFSSIPGYAGFTDPSADNFRHHLDSFYDNNVAGGTQILGRYKNFNGMEGNSPQSGTQSSTAFPDKEDLNRDNVITDTERYYEYRVPLRKDQLVVGRNFIVDQVTNTINGDVVSWYLFRIPIRTTEKRVVGNNGQEFGYKSLRFLRMYLTGWQQPTVLRFLQMQFIANQWRRYLNVITEPGGAACVNCPNDADNFAISTVGIEENGASNGGAIPYVTPPGIQRDREYGSTTTLRQQNEQSLRLCVEGLKDGYAKAAYKNVNLNLLRYKKLKLFLHAESSDPTLRDDQAQGFVRIGTDYTQNYYQYTLPLKLTPTGTGSDPEAVWPAANRVELSLEDFVNLKAERARAGFSLLVPYVKELPNGAKLIVLGNPDLSALQGLMIGVQNKSDNGQGSDQTLCIWADELRVQDFENQGGWAATARFNTRLADVANITATGSFTSVGFGSLQDRPSQRSIDNIARGDVNAAVAADKFLPEKLGLRVPVLLQAGIESRSPQYDPLDPDMPLTQSLESKFATDGEQQAYRREVTDQTRSKSISLLNVRKERTNPDRKPKPYDIENLALSYSLTERLHTDIQTDRDFTRTYTGALAYTYQPTPKSYAPLSKVKALNSPYLKLLQELNFTPLPSRFAFRADLDRRYNERFLQRTQAQGEVPTTDGIPGVYQKSFFINRIYDLKWDLTKSLILDYTATNRSSVDEGQGRTIGDSPEAQQNRDLLKKNLQQGGRTTNFNQTVAVTYRLPLDKFPLTDWLSADARYAANYSWQAASTALRAPNPQILPGGTFDPNDTTTTTVNIGNTIQNSRDVSVNGRIDLVKLYNKVKFLNIINNAPAGGAAAGKAGQSTMDRLRRGGAPEVAGAEKGAAKGAKTDAPADSAKGPELKALKAVLRSLMTARSLNFTFTQTSGMLLPGYLPRTRFFGLNNDFSAPGVPFILGQQYQLQELYDRASGKGWYTDRSDLLNTPVSSLRTQNLQVRTALEPFRDFNIQLEAKQQQVRNREAFYRLAIDTLSLLPLTGARDGELAPQLPLGSGSFSTSFFALNTLFGDLDKDNVSKSFNRFVANRQSVRTNLQDANTNGIYGYNSQDVLLPSFLDAYRGRSSEGFKSDRFNPFGMIPIPNWRVDYNGLSNLPFVQKYLRSVAITHSYSAEYQILGYTTSTQYADEPSGLATVTNKDGQLVPYYIINQVVITERLAPLVGINFQTLEKLNGRLDYGIDRSLALNTTNAQVTELRNKTMTIGFGYTTNRFRIPFRIGGEQRVLRNELNARLDLSIRDNITIQHSIVDVVVPTSRTDAGDIGRAARQITNGNRQVQIRPTVDYVVNQRLNLQFYFTRNVSQPRAATSFKNAATEGGVQLRYSLSQ